MVDAEDGRLLEDGVERRAQRLRGREVTAEGLLDDDSRPAGAARLAEPQDDLREHTGRDGEIVQRVRCTAELLAEGDVGRGSAVVTADVAEPLHQLREDRLVEAVVVLDALSGARAELLDRPLRPGNADDGHLKVPTTFHRVERWKDLLVNEVAGGPEEDQRVGVRNVHELLLVHDGSDATISRSAAEVRRREDPTEPDQEHPPHGVPVPPPPIVPERCRDAVGGTPLPPAPLDVPRVGRPPSSITPTVADPGHEDCEHDHEPQPAREHGTQLSLYSLLSMHVASRAVQRAGGW